MSTNNNINNVFGGNNFLFNTDPYFNELSKIEVFTAFKKNTSPTELYEKSGLKLLLHKLLEGEDLKKNIKGGFIEVSTFASTIDDNSLDAFNLSFFDLTKANEHLNRNFHENVSLYFKAIISKLREKNLIVFNHPDFTNEPDKIRNFISAIYDDEVIYDREIVDLVEKKYLELIDSISVTGASRANSKHTRDTILSNHLSIRKTNLEDIYTTYEGISEKMPRLVKDRVESEFGSLIQIDKKLFALHYLNHKLYHKKFQTNLNFTSPSIFISIPLLDSHPEVPNRYMGLGAVFIFLLLDKKPENPELFRKLLLEYCCNVPILVRSYLAGYIFQIGIEKRRQILKEATKSAIAAVMSRNMSHNVGSHVLVKLSEEKNLSDKKGIAAFNQYLKHRMSFIADISTSQTSVGGASFFESDILKKFRNLLLLKNYISGNDSINANSVILTYKCNIDGFDSSKDISVQVPADTIGKQAIYVFIENFIRNAVKYSNIPTKTKHKKGTKTGDQKEYYLEINFWLSQPQDDELKSNYYVIDVFDNCSKENYEKRKEIGKERNNDNPVSFKLIRKLQRDIDRSVLENGAPRVGGWGILEMKICAAFLRKYSLKDIDIPPNIKGDNQPDILTVNYYRKNKNGGLDLVTPNCTFNDADLNLGYRYYLLKPKKIAFPKSEYWTNGISNELQIQLELQGVYFIDLNNDISKKGIDHEILVLDESFNELSAKLGISTQRVLSVIKSEEKNTIKKYLTSLNITGLENVVWGYYCKQKKFVGSVEIYRSNEKIDLTNKNLSELIIYDDHGEHCESVCKISNPENSLESSPIYYYEKFGSQSGTSSMIENVEAMNDEGRELLQNRFKEVAYIEVLIIDERIQRSAFSDVENIKWFSDSKTGTKDIPLSHLLQKMKISVPNPGNVIDLDKQSFDKTNDNDLLIIERWIDDTLKDKEIRFMLVHLSIIEKLYDATPDSIKAFYGRWEKKWGDKLSIIIISGRGEPSTIPKESYFIPYDCVEEYLLRNRSKYNLINLIYSTNKKI